MDPNQQYQTPNQGGNYEFILSPDKPSKKLLNLNLGKSNFGLTLALIIGGAVVLMIILALLAHALGGSNRSSKDELIAIAETQDELIHVSTEGENGAVQQTTKNLAVTIEYSLTTQEQGVIKLLSSNGTKLGNKQLKLKESTTTDQQLTNATSTSTFDSVFIQITQQQLASYMNALKQLNISSTNKTVKTLTSNDYHQAQLLADQIPYVQTQIQAAGQ